MTESWPYNLPHPLIQRIHPLDPRSTVTVMETGRPRVRREFAEPLEMCEYNWNFTEDQFEIFKDFVEVNLAQGEHYFVLGGFEGGQLVNRTVAFLSPYTLERTDNLFHVSAMMEVVEEES